MLCFFFLFGSFLIFSSLFSLSLSFAFLFLSLLSSFLFLLSARLPFLSSLPYSVLTSSARSHVLPFSLFSFRTPSFLFPPDSVLLTPSPCFFTLSSLYLLYLSPSYSLSFIFLPRLLLLFPHSFSYFIFVLSLSSPISLSFFPTSSLSSLLLHRLSLFTRFPELRRAADSRPPRGPARLADPRIRVRHDRSGLSEICGKRNEQRPPPRRPCDGQCNAYVIHYSLVGGCCSRSFPEAMLGLESPRQKRNRTPTNSPVVAR